MKKLERRTVILLALTFVLSVILAGCGAGNKTNSNINEKEAVSTEEANKKNEDNGKLDTRSYTDYRGHTVDIPVSPERVIFAGETTGDLPQLGIKPVGVFGDGIEERVFEDQLTGATNVGFPMNLEITTSLNPDLIIIGNTDEEAYANLLKIAPTIMLDTFETLEVRMTELGEIFNKQSEAAAWLEKNKDAEAEMWKKIYDAGLKEGETATVFTYYPGDRLFIMARAGLSQLVYSKGGLKPNGLVQEILDANEGFRQISLEVIEQYAGDRIFILNPVADEAKLSTKELLENPVWAALPAVKNGYVYELDILKAESDASSRKWLLEELPKLMIKQ